MCRGGEVEEKRSRAMKEKGMYKRRGLFI